jgi:hypothetical protein
VGDLMSASFRLRCMAWTVVSVSLLVVVLVLVVVLLAVSFAKWTYWLSLGVGVCCGKSEGEDGLGVCVGFFV